jgi:prephenate dehydrogenase
MSFNPKKIVLYSVGLLGASLGLALKASGYQGRIAGVSSAKGLKASLAITAIDEGYSYDEVQTAVSGAGLLVLCSPISAIKDAFKKLAVLDLPADLVITDVGSTKNEIVAAAQKHLPPQVCFLGGHPMAGSEKSGPSAADPYLFQNAIFCFTPPGGVPTDRDREIAAFFENGTGCRAIFLRPALHDQVVAAVSHVPHLLAVALVNVAQAVENEIPDTLKLAAGGFRDMTRIASAPYALWHDILSTNKRAIAPLIDAMIEELALMKELLKTDSLVDRFEHSRATRLRIPANTKGFLRSLSEVLVVAKDQPGIIATIANALAGSRINIKDIEVMKVREGEGGTIRLAFESSAVAQAAITVLQQAGFIARERT